MRDLNWIQGSGSTSLHGQESVNVIGIKGIQKGTQRAALFEAFVGRNLPGNFVAINKKVEASCVHCLFDISQILWSIYFLQVSPKFLSWNTVVGSKEVQKSSNHLHFFFAVARMCRKIKNKEGLVGVPCGAETKLWVWYLVFSKSPVHQ